MVYRYDAAGDELACASCLPTEGLPTSDASLPTHGLGITDDGRAFFNSNDQLVMRDTNGKEDAYEWKNGAISLISTGFSAFPSSLLTVTSDGNDAFFFTRETLVANDHNGAGDEDLRRPQGRRLLRNPELAALRRLRRVPRARAPSAAPRAPARDLQRHGRPVLPPPVKCKKGFVKKHGKCVRKKRKAPQAQASQTGGGRRRGRRPMTGRRADRRSSSRPWRSRPLPRRRRLRSASNRSRRRAPARRPEGTRT